MVPITRKNRRKENECETFNEIRVKGRQDFN